MVVDWSHQVCSQPREVPVLEVPTGVSGEEVNDQGVLDITYHADRGVHLGTMATRQSRGFISIYVSGLILRSSVSI